jgi:site-specific recombinase XerD
MLPTAATQPPDATSPRSNQPPAGDVVGDFTADVAGLLHLGPAEAARLARIGMRWRDSVAPSTLRALRTDVRRWTSWCRLARTASLPARPQDLAAFIDSHAERWTPATIRRVLASIARVHRVLALPDPTKDEEVRVALKGMARRRAEAGQGRQRQAAGLTERALDAMLATLGERLIDLRDRALLLVGRDLLARRSELVALQVRDLAPSDDGGATVLIGRSKTDQEGQGTYRYLGPEAYAAVRAWLDAAGLTDGPLLRSVHVTGKIGRKLHEANVNDILKKLARRAAPALKRRGIDPEGISGHSCRVGMAQDLVAAGFDVAAIMQAGRWKSSAMVARYTERLLVAQGAVAQYHARTRARHT